MSLTIGELVGYLRLDDAQFQAGLTRAGAGMQAVQGKAESAGRSMANAVGGGVRVAATALTAATAAGVALGSTVFKTGVQYNGMQQASRAALTTILKGAEAANAQMDKLDDFASNSPFSKQVFITAQQQLLGFGMAAERVLPTLDAIQNAVAAAGGGNQEIAEIADVLAKVTGTGKITAETLNQLGYRGIDAATIIGESLGKSGNQIRESITKGTLDADTALRALTDGMQARFGGAAANVKETWLGAKDRIKAATRDIGAAMAEPFVGHKGGGRAIAWANEFADLLRAVQKQVTPLVDVLLPRIEPAFVAASRAMGQAKDAVAGMNIGLLNTQLDRLSKYAPLIAGVSTALFTFGANNITILQKLGLSGLNPVLAGLAALVAASPELRAVGREFLTSLQPIAPAAGEAARALADSLARALRDLVPPVGQLLQASVPLVIALGTSLAGAVEVAAALLDKAVPIVARLAEAATSAGGPVETLTAALLSSAPAVAAVVAALGPAADLVGDLVGLFASLPGPVQAAVVAFAALRLLQPQMATLAATIGGPLVGAMRGLNERMAVQAALASASGREIGRLGTAAAAAQVGVGGLRGVLGGVLGVLGGAWGLALSAAAIGIGLFAKQQADARRRVEELADTLDKQTGAITENTRALVVAEAERQNLLTLAEGQGIRLQTFTDALLGEKDALQQVVPQLERAADGIRSMDEDTYNAATTAGFLLDALSGQNDELATARDRAQRTAEALGGVERTTEQAEKPTTRLSEAMRRFADTTADAETRSRGLKEALDVLHGRSVDMDTIYSRMYEQLDRLKNGLYDSETGTYAFAEALDEQSGKADVTTDKGRLLNDMMNAYRGTLAEVTLGAYEAARAEGKDHAEALHASREAGDLARRGMVDLVGQMSGNKRTAEDLADAYGLLVGDFIAKIAVQGASEAVAAVQSVLDRIRALPDTKTIHLRMQQSGNVPMAHRLGTNVPMAAGGVVASHLPAPPSRMEHLW